ncbi:glycosyltransferase family 2 protein [Geodermatophilus sp. SYSU D00804]
MKFHRPQPLSGPASVSVLIPCYRYGRYLRAVVDSALDQPGLDVDVLIVDDASPDDSAEVARSIAATDPRVRVLVNETNLGHIATYNRGIAELTGEFAVLLSADDLLVPGAVTRAVALMQAHPSVGLAYGHAPQFRGTPPRPRRGPALWTTWSGHEWLGLQCRRGRNPAWSPEVVMRRTVMTEFGGYDPDMPHAGDMELWLRAALHVDVGRVNGPDQALYRDHGENMHVVVFGAFLDDATARREVFDSILGDGATGILAEAERQRLLRVAHRALAREAVHTAILALEQGLPDSRKQAKACLDFAVETWPDIRDGRLWRAAESWPGSQRSTIRIRTTATARRVRDVARWRLWRYLGV